MSIFTTFIILLVFSTNILRKFEAVCAELSEGETFSQGDDWFVTRDTWKAKKYNNTPIMDTYRPLHLVIIGEAYTEFCNRIKTCSEELQRLQRSNNYARDILIDIPYNFLIGNDGRVYEGRGWNVVGSHTAGYNDCSLGVAFMGDYSVYAHSAYSATVTELQQRRARRLFEEGVKLGYLHPNFHVLGISDLLLPHTYTYSTDLYQAVRRWSNYDFDNRYQNRTCDQIQELFKK